MGQFDKEEQAFLEKLRPYATEYHLGLISDAICYYEANLTKDKIENHIFIKDEDNNKVSTVDLLGISTPCKFSDFATSWIKYAIAPFYQKTNDFLSNPKDFLIENFNKGKSTYVFEYWYTNKQKKDIFLSQFFILIKTKDEDICAFAILKNLTFVQKENALRHKNELERHAYFDPITNGYNFIKFKKSVIEKNIPGSLITMDIHSFKLFDTICEIGTGNKVIKEIWDRLIEVFDFDKNELAAHVNADQFVAFVPTENSDEIITKIKSISYALNFIATELSVPQIKMYFGVSSWNPSKDIDLANDEAVSAKNNAKNIQDCEYSFFNKKDMERLVQEERIISNFEEALAQNEFHIWYQPKFNPITNELIGAEALVRWIKNNKIYLSPRDFIPLFENNGIMRRFDQHIFRKICIQQKNWIKQGKKIIPISVNLSPISMYYKDIASIYNHIIESVDLEKKFVPIEITETAAVTLEVASSIINSFLNSNFELHMDDFGSGYSSLSSLIAIKYNTWKLDKSLIDSIGNFTGEKLLHHIILLAKEIGIHVVAEGVETKEQNEFLKNIGCDSIQGFYYSRPIDCLSFEKLLKNN